MIIGSDASVLFASNITYQQMVAFLTSVLKSALISLHGVRYAHSLGDMVNFTTAAYTISSQLKGF